MKVRLLAGVLALLASLALIAAASAKTPKPARTTAHYYLALGDSLSVGYQPNAAGVGHETDQGYVNDIYAGAKKKVKDLKLVEFGCPGDTTTSLLSGVGNAAGAKAFGCDRQDGSQLKAAEAFLKAHAAKGEVPLITVDIGANDVDSCVSDVTAGLSAVASCVEQGISKLNTNTPKILAALHKAAPKGTFSAAMNLYDPILADALSTDPSAQGLATLSLGLVKTINTDIAKADSANGFKTADVATAFGTYDQTPAPTAGTPLAATGLTTVPTDVANICDLTYMCAPAPQGPNIHARPAGYATMARAFGLVLPKTL